MQLTALYALPLTLLMIGLSAQVSAMRARTGISILDGGNMALAVRMRRHGTLIETLPMALLLMALAEAGGATSFFIHAAGLTLLTGRLLHPFGLFDTRPATFARIAGGSLTWLSMLISMAAIVITHVWS